MGFLGRLVFCGLGLSAVTSGWAFERRSPMVEASMGVMELHMAGANRRDKVVLHFDRAVDASSARDISHYRIDGLEVLSAKREGLNQGTSARRVMLTVSEMDDRIYEVAVDGLRGFWGAAMDPAHSRFDFRGFDAGTTRYAKFRWMGDSVGWGLWPILTDPGYAIYELTLDFFRARQEGTGVEFHGRNYSVPGYRSINLIEDSLDDVIADRPDLVLVEIGGNDFGVTSFERFGENLDFIYSTLRDELPGAQIIGADIYDAVLNAYPFGGDGHAVEEWVALIREIGARYDVPIIDVYTPFLGGGKPGGKYMSLDGLHPQSTGHALAATAGFEVVRRLPHRPAPPSVAAVGSDWVEVESWVGQGDFHTERLQLWVDGELNVEVPYDAQPVRIGDLSSDQEYEMRFRAVVPASADGPRVVSGASDPVFVSPGVVCRRD